MPLFRRRCHVFFVYFVIVLGRFDAKQSAKTSPEAKLDGPEELLKLITGLTQDVAGEKCVGGRGAYEVVRIPLQYNLFPNLTGKVDLISQILGDELAGKLTTNLDLKQDLLKSVLCRVLYTSSLAKAVRISVREGQEFKVFSQEKQVALELQPKSSATARTTQPTCNMVQLKGNNLNDPWYHNLSKNSWDNQRFQIPNVTSLNEGENRDGLGHWTFPYFNCNRRSWMTTYAKLISFADLSSAQRGCAISVDVDISQLDINQCEHVGPKGRGAIQYFRNTHKCHRNSSSCVFEPGSGWRRGGYVCQCKDGFYNASKSPFSGSVVEVAWDSKNTDSYVRLFECRPCSEGCSICKDNKPCRAIHNMAFRIVLLTISVLCIVLTFIIMGIVYRNRSVKVIKVASPAFLEICLFGCIIMYLEMATIFPVLDIYSCIATKWARHMGFCITFSSLLMKTWRVSLTYRVKSAHKIKLTDKQLLQWMTPILLIMSIYLGAWTISDSPKGEDKMDSNLLWFKQCTYNWWDHALAIGEMTFLLWGVKVCYGVRKAESFFDEAKCISWAVYNITIVNIIMASFHIFIFPEAGPDLKYFFGFIRTQLSTTTTIGLVFGPKLIRVLKGTGDQLDNRARAKGVTASFSINGIGGSGDEPPDPLEENEELKEEIQKLAAQIEFMKIVHMEMNNRHLRPKPGGYFSTDKNSVMSAAGQSPTVTKNSISKMELCENSSSVALNPSSEIAPERV